RERAARLLRSGAMDFIIKDASLAFLIDLPKRAEEAMARFELITERKRIERQLFQAQKMQSVGTLAGGIAHEFNNLLAGIQGYASLGLREPGLGETLREFLRHIVDLSERAAGLTRQLLAFARKPALTRQPTAMDQLLRSTADLVKKSLNI